MSQALCGMIRGIVHQPHGRSHLHGEPASWRGPLAALHGLLDRLHDSMQVSAHEDDLALACAGLDVEAVVTAMGRQMEQGSAMCPLQAAWPPSTAWQALCQGGGRPSLLVRCGYHLTDILSSLVSGMPYTSHSGILLTCLL